AKGGVSDAGAKALEQLHIALSALAFYDSVKNLEHPGGAYSAGHALAAAFLAGKVHKEPCHIHHAGVLIHNDKSARAHDGARCAYALIVDVGVKQHLWQTAA